MHTDTQTRAVPGLAERIRAIVPDHTAIVLKGTNSGGSWTWSTSQGLWAIYSAPDSGSLTVSGPGGTWAFDGLNQETALRQIEGMLRALDAIPAAAQAA